MSAGTWRERIAVLVERVRATERSVVEAEIAEALDAYGAPDGITLHDRLRAWEQRERRWRYRAELAAEGAAPTLFDEQLARLRNGGIET